MNLSPVIIIGMHRSGSSMLVNLLENSGIFFGEKKELNNEAKFFLRLNEWILRQAHSSWDNPYNFQFIDNHFKTEISSILYYYLKSIKRIEFLGINKFFKYRDIRQIDIPWGWKDPRNTFTIDIWKEIFKNARILHICRNPIDVAESLRQREFFFKNKYKYTKRPIKEIFFLNRAIYPISMRVQNIYEGIKLWENYITKAYSLDKEFKYRILHLKYENFVENPIEGLNKIVNFLDLKISSSNLKVISKIVNKKRKYAFVKDKSLIEIYKKIKGNETLRLLGYNDILN